MNLSLSPEQEHYLKRELIKLEIADEFERFNDALVLRRFGGPFSAEDPKSVHKRPGSAAVTAAIGNEIPLAQFFFHEILTKLPFLASTHQNPTVLWVDKVQVFYENFMGMSISETKDREELTKRKKMANKVNKLFLMIFNSGLGTMNESEYYKEKQRTIESSDTHIVQSERLQRLLAPSRADLKKQLRKNTFINGISLNVVGVRLVEKQSSSTKLWNSVAMINQLQKNDNYYEFLIRSRVDLPESEEIFVARRYGEFKALHSKLKKKFPGKRLPNLPSKVKSDINVEDNDEIDDSDDDEDSEELKEEQEKEDNIRERLHEIEAELQSVSTPSTPKSPSSERFVSAPSTPIASPTRVQTSAISSPKSPSKGFKSKFVKLPWSSKSDTTKDIQVPVKPPNEQPREKTRLGLRAYLRSLLEDIEISHCAILKEFLFKNRIHKLTESESKDIIKRENLDLLFILNQLKFQNETYNKVQQLKQSSMTLRNVLLKEQNGLISVFEEIKTKEHITELSPMLRNFIDWCKLEVSATIYQAFLGQDSSYEFFSQVKRLHSLMPYSIMINILKFTNPMSVMKTMINLLMSSPFGGKSLLQTLFYEILSDDIKSQNKLIAELEEKTGEPLLIERLKWFVFESANSHHELIGQLRLDADVLKTDLLLVVLTSPRITVTVEPSNEIVGELMESYAEYKKLKKVKTEEDSLFINLEKVSLYSDLRQLYKLYIRTHDKEIMQQLWSQPELTMILKDLFTLFYQPLVNLFKYSHVDRAFKHFQSFMNDLIKLIDVLNNQIYTIDPNRIVSEIMNVLNKHEDEFYRFLHEIYQNDKDKIFEGLINWIDGILKLLRVAKSESGFEKIDISKIITGAKSVNRDELTDELNGIVDEVKRNHELIKKRIEKAEQTKQSNGNEDIDIQQNWDFINKDLEFFNYEDFGINDYDVDEFQDDSSDDDDDDDDDDETSNDVKSKVTNEKELTVKNEEIAKLLSGFKKEVSRVLNSYAAGDRDL